MGNDEEESSTDNVSISLNSAGNNVINVSENAKRSVGDGINISKNVNNSSVTLTSIRNNEINASSSRGDAIYVDVGADSDVILNAGAMNKLIANNNGIDHGGKQSVSLKAENGINMISAANGDGLRNVGSGEIVLTGLENEINTGDNGIQVGDTEGKATGKVTVEANNGYNKIIAGNNGIEVADSAENIEIGVSANGYNVIQGDVDGVKLGGSGKVTVSALANKTDTNIALFSNEDVPYNNYFIGGENGIHRVENSTATFTATADNNNYISGANNGILAEGVADTGEIPSISVTANNGSNIIGFETFTDENGELHEGQIGQNGVSVSSGSVNLTAGYENKITATEKGITVSGENSQVSLVSNKNTITVINDNDNTSYVSGIELSNKASVEISKNTNVSPFADDGTYITVKGNGPAYGIYSTEKINAVPYPSGSLSLESSGLYIDVLGVSKAGKHTIAGVYWEGNTNSKLSISTGKQGINIKSTAIGDVSGTNNSGTSYAFWQKSTLDAEVKTTGNLSFTSSISGTSTESTSLYSIAANSNNSLVIDASSIDILANNTGTNLSSNTYGIQALKDGNSPDDVTNVLSISAKGEKGHINVIAQSEAQATSGDVFGINVSQSTVNLTSSWGTVNIISTKNNNNMFSAAVFSAISPVNAQFSILNISTKEGAYLKGDDYVIYSAGKSNTTINTTTGTNYLVSNGNGYGIANMSGANVEVLSHEGSNVIEDVSTGIYSAKQDGYEWNEQKFATTTLTAKGLTESNNIINSGVNGIYAADSFVSLDSTNGINSIAADSGYAAFASSASINLNAGSANLVSGKTYGLAVENKGYISLTSSQNSVVSSGYGIYATGSSNVELTASNVNEMNVANSTAVYASDLNTRVTLDALKNNIYANTGIWSLNQGKVKISGNNNIDVDQFGIYSDSSSNVDVISNQNNLIKSGVTTSGEKGYFANSYAVYAKAGSSVLLQAQDTNQLLGAIYATDNETNVDMKAANNTVNSYAYISGAGGLTDEKIISALYAQGDGAKITLDGNNSINTYAVSESSDLERVVWAYNGADIYINGQTAISTDRYQENRDNSKDISVVAGTSTGLEEKTYEEIMSYDGPVAHVNVNYEGDSSITGDVLAAYAGEVNVDLKKGASGSMNITGNLLAGNNGVLNVNLGEGGKLTGRVDDYGDAGVIDGTTHGNGVEGEGFFNPAFSSKVIAGGQVNLTMGEGSRWELTGQSWITNINTSTAAISENSPVIDLVNSNTDRNTAAHALTVYSLNGNAVFNMSLDGNRDVSDMLYVKKATGEYLINVIDPVSNDDMYASESALASGRYDGLRFATVGAGSNASFRAVTVDQGVIDVEYEVGTDSYHNNEENVHYNGDALDTQKPGDTTVDTFFNTDGTPGEAVGVEENTPETQALAANVMPAKAVAENVEAQADSGLDEVTNFKLIGRSGESISDGGKTVIDMSRANYANAVYMDTLNKRQGEARFVGDTDHGVWVRLRHDNIGKDDSFRTHNTMVEVGIEQRDVNDYGEFHTGVALDYMNGQIDYHTVDGDGDIERYGVWFYTTYLGNDGQYADLVLKYGHLKNDFGFNTKTQGEHVTGDYTNEVASISAEYGWKFSNSYNYYIEPQAQLQYSYVTGADYTTSQGSKVELDSIHSLIGRIGFRAGKDFNTETPITAYIRGDVLHEFLGDQDIYAYDSTGVMDVTYKNDDTWYSAGVGLSVQSSENTYFFIEGEQVFGADNDSTYTVSGGFKHSF